MKHLPVIENADDLLKLATKTASCHDCRHMFADDPAFMRCGAQGGQLARELNRNGTCVHWEQVSWQVKKASRNFEKLGWRFLFVFLFVAVAALIILGIIAVGFEIFGGASDDQCRDFAEPLPRGINTVNCDHPDHRVEIVDDLVLCRCQENPNETLRAD